MNNEDDADPVGNGNKDIDLEGSLENCRVGRKTLKNREFQSPIFVYLNTRNLLSN